MTACALCGRSVEDGIVDPSTGALLHAACIARRAPQDAVVAAIAALALVLTPAVLVWAG